MERRLHLCNNPLAKGVGEGVMKLAWGYSKDRRPDLKQAVLSLRVSGPAAMPLWMEPLDGNGSDKKNFHETIKKVRQFQKQIRDSLPLIRIIVEEYAC